MQASLCRSLKISREQYSLVQTLEHCSKTHYFIEISTETYMIRESLQDKNFFECAESA